MYDEARFLTDRLLTDVTPDEAQCRKWWKTENCAIRGAIVSRSSDDELESGLSLEELIQRKRSKWSTLNQQIRSNCMEGFWMSLFGLAIVLMGLTFGFTLSDLAKPEVREFKLGYVVQPGLAVIGIGVYWMITRRSIADE
jgi:hypothetical protein